MFDRYQITGRLLLTSTIASLGILSTASAWQDEPVIPAEVEAWRSNLWEAAVAGDQELVEDHLASIPRDADPASMAILKESLLARDGHDAQSVDDRDAGRREAIEELQEKLDASDVTGALTAAVRLQTLSDDWDAVLDQERIRSLIARAEDVEAAARAEGDWLQVQEILFRLRTLHEDTSRKAIHSAYDEQLEEVNRRIGLLARYAPRALYELRARNMARLEPETEFPEFNEAFAEDWKEALNGISERMVRASLRTAASEHVSNCGWKPLLDGGLEAVEIFSTTDQLVENFAGTRRFGARWPGLAGLWSRRSGHRLAEQPARRSLAAGLPPDHAGAARGQSRDHRQVPDEVLLREFAEGATYRLEDAYADQYTQVIWPEQLRRFQQQVQGDFVGVGVMIRHDDKREIMIVNPLEGSPASRGGVARERPDRRGGRHSDHRLEPHPRRRARSPGRKGEEVLLTLRREECRAAARGPAGPQTGSRSARSTGGTRSPSTTTEPPAWDWYLDPEAGIGYIRLTSFNDESFSDFLVAVDEMRADAGPLRGLDPRSPFQPRRAARQRDPLLQPVRR